MTACYNSQLDCSSVCAGSWAGRWILIGLDGALERSLRACLEPQGMLVLAAPRLLPEMRMTALPQTIVCSVNALSDAGSDVLKALTGSTGVAVLVVGDMSPSRRLSVLLQGVSEIVSPDVLAGELYVRAQRFFCSDDVVSRPPPSNRGPVIELGELAIDRVAHRVFVGDDEVHFSTLDYRLMNDFVDHCDELRTRQQLLADVWSAPGDASRTVDTHVRRLRVKLGRCGWMIQTVRGLGYRFSARS